jgi:uncharacterized 2Fe-2S/4Fe-4S cluster protein (DUF4445 family)|tara:strand:- start:31825 stop:33846 length:2022 start_codon:yes stop_codon:yes gene_type:complete
MTATKQKKECKVVFMPSGKRGYFDKGTSLLGAARQLGVDIDSVCGGRALCGRCQVEVTEGDFSKHNIHSSFASVEIITEAENKYHERRGLDQNRRLSCQALLMSDAVIDVPASSQVHQQVIRKKHEAHDIDIDPIIKSYYVQVEEPDMHKSAGDLLRLMDALSKEWDLEALTCSLEVVQSLQKVLRLGKWNITVAVRDNSEIISVWPGFKEILYGVAIDVGSTTIAAHLCELSTGKVVASSGLMNPQIRFGEDLMSRVSYIMMNDGGERDLIKVVRESIDKIIANLVKEHDISSLDICEITLVGNPIMHHLVLGINPIELGAAPFALATDTSTTIRASKLNINVNPGCYVYVLPCVAGHVGADAAGVILAEEPYAKDEISLVVDIGTNAEIILGNKDRLLAASSPTGPAFEGAQISSGQRAAPGAIERARIDPVSLEPRFKIIGCDYWSDEKEFLENLPAGGITGICGSGIIEIVAELYLSGVVDQDGKINENAASRSKRIIEDGRTYSYLLHQGDQDIKITQNDIRAIQLAKAALYAGVKLLMAHLKIKKVDRIRLAGAFGTHIDVKYAMALGLIPDCELEQVSSAGNAAGTGARITLLDKKSRAKLEHEVRLIEKIETAVEKSFQDEFVAAMALPHQKDDFTNLATVFNLPERSKKASGMNMRKRNRRRKS